MLKKVLIKLLILLFYMIVIVGCYSVFALTYFISNLLLAIIALCVSIASVICFYLLLAD